MRKLGNETPRGTGGHMTPVSAVLEMAARKWTSAGKQAREASRA